MSSSDSVVGDSRRLPKASGCDPASILTGEERWKLLQASARSQPWGIPGQEPSSSCSAVRGPLAASAFPPRESALLAPAGVALLLPPILQRAPARISPSKSKDRAARKAFSKR